MIELCNCLYSLTHWGRLTLIYVSKLTIIASINGLSPGQCQAINWANNRIVLIRTLGTNFSEILSEIHTFSFKKMHLKMSSAKWRQCCLGFNLLSTTVMIRSNIECYEPYSPCSQRSLLLSWRCWPCIPASESRTPCDANPFGWSVAHISLRTSGPVSQYQRLLLSWNSPDVHTSIESCKKK